MVVGVQVARQRLSCLLDVEGLGRNHPLQVHPSLRPIEESLEDG